MKTFKLRFTVLALAVTLCCGIASAVDSAPVRDGHVYRIVNKLYNHAVKANGTGNLVTADVNESDQSQLWLAEADGDGFYMRSLSDGYYITSQRARAQSWQAQYAIDPDAGSMLLKFVADGDAYLIHTVADYGKTDDQGVYGYAQETTYRSVIGGNDAAESARWTFAEVSDMTPAEIADKKAAWRQCVSVIVPGAAYRITNYQYGHAMVPGNRNSLVCAVVDNTDDNQVWIIEENTEGEGYLLRHYLTGMVISSPCRRSQPWSVVDGFDPEQANCAMYFNKKLSGYGISTVSTRGLTTESLDYTYADENMGKTVISNYVAVNHALWHLVPAEGITADDIADKKHSWGWADLKEAGKTLEKIFADYACTELLPEYASMTAEQISADKNVQSLPDELRAMVLKIHSGDWSETDTYSGNKWDDAHARKLRVQLYEPFSDCVSGAALAGVQAYTNVNNPTGIVTDSGKVLYVMVDEEPAEGATLYIAGRTGEGTNMATINNATDGTRLKKGLNIVLCNQDVANMIVYYTVNTTDGKNRLRVLSDFDDIKIHIEGGSLNGYFNMVGDALYTPDTNEDWLYYRERARHPMFTLLSRYNTLYIHFDDILNESGARTECLKSLCSPEAYAQGLYDLIATLKAWDEIYMSETMLMGLRSPEEIEAEKAIGHDFYNQLTGDPVARDDYHKYFNNRVMGISMRDAGFMNATTYRTAYNPGTLNSILREFPTGDLWGPAHEFGHVNQQPMLIAGTTEESNNVFSNVALYYRGVQATRAEYPSVQRGRFNEDQTFLQHGTWGTTRMWMQLWLYYHCVGHDKNFYPRLYELLRTNPLRKTPAPGHAGVVNPILSKDDLLHFAKMACVAAGEDLTDFFESWGFFVVQDGFFIDDYTQYTSYLSAEDIAEWKADIARMAAENGWKKNTAILFIDDRVGSPRQSYGQFDKTKCGSMGGLKDFTEGAPVTGNYTYIVNGTTVTVTGGQGGVGFLVYDTNGKLIGFANEPTFEVSPATAEKIRKGDMIFKVVDDNNTETVIYDAIHNGTLEDRFKALDGLFEKSAELIATADPEGHKVGYLKPEVVASLLTVYNDVKGKRDNGEITSDNFVGLYESLSNEYFAVADTRVTANNTVTIVPGAVYAFTSNLKYDGKGIMADRTGSGLANVAAGRVNMEDAAQQWIFEPAGRDHYYNIRNIKYNKYIGKAPADGEAVALQDEPMTHLVQFRELGGISISPLGNDVESLYDNGLHVTRHTSGDKASRWTLTLVNDWERKLVMAELLSIIARSEDLLADAGTVTDTPQGPVGTPAGENKFVTGDMLVTLHTLVAEGKAMVDSDPIAGENEIKGKCAAITEAYDTLLGAMNLHSDRLVELIGKTRALAKTIAEVSEEIVPVTLTARDMYSNAPHMGSGSDKFTSWDVLFDNDLNTYFHSSYENAQTVDGLDHYIRIALPDDQGEPTDYIFSYMTRKNESSTWVPVDADLECSADGETWQTLAELSDELPLGSASRFESEPLSVPAGMRYLRFIVHENRRSALYAGTGVSAGHCYFVLSELALSRYALDCTPDFTTYPAADVKTIREAMISAQVAEQTLARPDYGHEEYDAAYDVLYPCYRRLMEILDSKTGLDSIGIDDEDALRDAVIYNLNGYRVNRITTPGIYIINGKKYMIR